MTRVLVVDDEPQVRLAVRGALSRAGFDVLVASDGRQAFETLATAAPEVVVLDLGLPDADGVDLVRNFRTWTSVPVLILSGVTDQARKVQALEAGADDFLQKPFGLEELVARLRALLRRVQVAGEDEVSRTRVFQGLEVDLANRVVSRAGTKVHLTPTEWRILEALVTNPGKLLTHRWMLRTVWDDGHGDETRAALRAHLRSLRAKIGDDAGAPIYIATESGAGYRWVGTEATATPLIDEGVSGVDVSDEELVAARAAERDPAKDAATREVAHDVNNALTAMRMALHVVRGRVGRFEPEVGEQLAVPLESFESALGRVGTLVLELERRALDEPPEEQD